MPKDHPKIYTKPQTVVTETGRKAVLFKRLQNSLHVYVYTVMQGLFVQTAAEWSRILV